MARKRKTTDEIVEDTDKVDREDDFDEKDEGAAEGEEATGEMGSDGEDAEKPVNKITRRKAGKEVYELLGGVLSKWFKSLEEAKLKIGILMCDAGKDGQEKPIPAVKSKGMATYGTAKILNAESRILGSPDAMIKIDVGVWDALSEKQKKGLLHRLCMHLTITTDEGGKVKKDDANRPIIKMRQPDGRLEVFRDNIKAFGDDSPDVVEFQKFKAGPGQMLMEFMAVG